MSWAILPGRVTKFCRTKFGETIPNGGEFGEQEEALILNLDERLKNYTDFMDAREVRKSAQELRAIWVAGNEYLQTAAPWSTIKEKRSTSCNAGSSWLKPNRFIRSALCAIHSRCSSKNY